MAPFHSLQPTFAGGEFAPSLYLRVDLQKFGTGLKRAKNFFVHPHGGASNRPGTRFVREVKDSTKRTRLIDFQFSTTQAYAIEFGHLYVRFHTDGGTVMDGLVPYEVVTPYTEDDLEDLKVTQSADVLYIVHPNYQPRTLSRLADAPPNWQMATFSFSEGPFMVSNTTESHTIAASATSGTGVTLTGSTATFDADHVGALWRIKHYVPGEAYKVSTLATNTNGTALNCGGTWRLITLGTWEGTVHIEKSTDGSTWTQLRQFSSGSGGAAFNYNTFGTDEGQFLVRVRYAHTSGTLQVELTTDPYEHTGIAEITGFTSATVATATIRERLASTSATWDWAEGSWSNYNGWPTDVVFFQDRLAFCATETEPQTVWFSETGEYTKFGRSNPIVDSDGISVNLPSRKLNGIRNLTGLQEIVALTSATDWTIGSSAGGAITPTTVDTKLHGYRGSSGVDPVIVGNRLIYVQPMGSVVRDMGYDYQVNGFRGENLSIFANHLFTGYSIRELAYQQEPDSLVWAIRSDGILLSMTYVPEQEVIAWTWHETEGEFESVCSLPADGYDEVWVIVKRGEKRNVERFVRRMASTDSRDQVFLDSSLTYDEPIEVESIAIGATVVVTSTGHGLSNGETVMMSGFEGLSTTITVDDVETEFNPLNWVRYQVINATANTYQLGEEETGDPVDGTDWEWIEPITSYQSDGYARELVDTVAGLDHLEGETVKILADGNVYNDQVVSGGEVTLDPPAAIVHVGLGYECDLQTLPVELRLQDGTTQDRSAQLPSVTIEFLNSRGGYIGTEEAVLDEVVQREREALGSPIALFSGPYEQAVHGGYQKRVSIFFRQSDPLPVTILAIMPKVETGG
jgi:hypothetical protein